MGEVNFTWLLSECEIKDTINKNKTMNKKTDSKLNITRCYCKLQFESKEEQAR